LARSAWGAVRHVGKPTYVLSIFCQAARFFKKTMHVHDAVVAASTDMQGAMLVDRDGKVVNKVSGYEFRHRTGEDLEIGSRYLVSDPEGPYFKCGIYLWRFNPRDFTTSGPRPGRVRKEQHT
jgi:hypothetical protein